MFRKIMLIFIESFLIQFGVITQALVVFMLLIIFLLLNMTKYPFQTIVLNQLETMSLLTSMISIFCGIFFIVSIQTVNGEENTSNNSSGVVLSEHIKMFFFFVIVFANLTFFVYWTIKAIQEFKAMLIKKFSFIYIYVCLCGNRDKYKLVKVKIEINEENEILREKYMESLRKLQNVYEEGTLILNKKTLEKVLLYLDHGKVLTAAGIEPADAIPAIAKKEIMRRIVRKEKS